MLQCGRNDGRLYGQSDAHGNGTKSGHDKRDRYGIALCVVSFFCTWAELLLAAVILARSTSYVMTKIGLQGMAPFSLLGIRFITAFLFLLPLGWRRLKSVSAGTWLRGMLLGTSFFAVMAAEVLGLRTTEASAAAFLENTAIVFVPLLEAVLRRSLPDIPILLSTLVSFSGVALLTLKGGSFSISQGESLCLAAAAFYACTIILTDRLSRRDDPLALGILQVGFIGLYGIVMTGALAHCPRCSRPAGSLPHAF